MAKTKKKSSTPSPSAEAAANVAALMRAPTPTGDVAGAAVDPSEAEFAAKEAAAAAEPAGEETGEVVHVELKKPAPGAWMRRQEPPKKAQTHYRLVSLSKPRRVLHAEVPAEAVRFVHDDEGRRVLVFDGIRCPRGVVTYHGVRCFLDGGPKASPQAQEIESIKARLAELESRPVGDFAEAAE